MTPPLKAYEGYEADVELCRKVHKMHGKTFYIGSLLLPRSQREAAWILYAFFRYPDEIVDTEFKGNLAEASLKLNEWRSSWKNKRSGKAMIINSAEGLRILTAADFIFSSYSIPDAYADAFLDAMDQDSQKNRYKTYAELEEYMYGSASVVGLMMSYVMCAGTPDFLSNEIVRNSVLNRAKALGEALQLTNFLRDVGEDIHERGRIYLPEEDMKKFLVKDEDIMNDVNNAAFKKMMKFEIERAKHLYQFGNEGIALLPKESRKAIMTASVVYSRILSKIEKANYDVFSQRVHVPQIEKIYWALRSMLGITSNTI